MYILLAEMDISTTRGQYISSKIARNVKSDDRKEIRMARLIENMRITLENKEIELNKEETV
jgi:G:T-mismatch repair DNA endonuclease (very short patch repair protein)